MNYQRYGISPELVKRVKLKMKNPLIKERVKAILEGIDRKDLQNRNEIKKRMALVSRAVGEKITAGQAEALTDFIIDQKIDPNNSFHLIKLWNMFR